jgi:transcriptional regulator with XRE-family HTH domain
MISGMGLPELRAAMDLRQEALAETLHVEQASISKIERRSDMYISTLRKTIKAMGGKIRKSGASAAPRGAPVGEKVL